MRFLPAWKTQNHAAVYTGVVAYDADAQAYFDAIVTNGGSPFSDARKLTFSDFVAGLKSDSIWSKLIAAHWLSADQAIAALINAKNPAIVASAVNSPTFTANVGYTGDGATSYIDSGYLGTALSDTDASMFFRVRTRASALRATVGYRSARGTLLHGSTTTPRGFVVAATQSVATTVSANDQFVCIARTGTTQYLQINDATEDTDTVATDTLNQSNVLRYLADQISYSDGTLAFAGFGQYLNSTERTALRSRIETLIWSW